MKQSQLVATSLAAMATWAAPAAAHIDINLGGTHEQRDPEQKDAPCGTAGSQRGTKVYTYRPGATINLSLVETFPHPGYFRIAFDSDGDDDFTIPTGTSGEFGNCAGDPKCGPGLEDFCSDDTVLIDNLEPHSVEDFEPMRNFSVTLPNVECDNCTLQVIQMMNDFNAHPAPYPDDDLYYRCIDIVLSNDAPEVTDTPVQNKSGIVCTPPVEPGTGGTQAGTGGVDTGTGGVDTGTGGMQASGGGTVGSTGGAVTTGGGAVGTTGGVQGPALTGGVAAGGTLASTGGTVQAPTTGGPATDSSGCSVSAGSSSRPSGQLLWIAAGLAFVWHRRRSTQASSRLAQI